MPNSETAALRLKAWLIGHPIPIYETRHVAIHPERAITAAFVRMGGESAPWGIAIGQPSGKAHLFSVPEPRNRDLVAEMVAEAAPYFLEHFPKKAGPADPLQQLWLPNRTHLDMLHHLAYAYTFAKWGGGERAKTLRSVGRLMGWLFREAKRPGQMTVVVASDILRDSYAFPSDAVRQAHLGYLMAWLTTKGDRNRRLAAASAAERLPISTTLDPSLERDVLDRLVEGWGQSRKAEDAASMKRQAREIAKHLEPELDRRFALTNSAVDHLLNDGRDANPGLQQLVSESQQECFYQYARIEAATPAEEDGPAFVASPETDRYAPAGAARYYVNQASEEQKLGALIHGDAQLQREAISAGDAVTGKIVEVWDEGSGRSTRPVWRIQCEHAGPLRVREGSTLCVANLSKRTVRVREVEWVDSVTVQLVVEVDGLKTVPRVQQRPPVLSANDSKLVGNPLTLLPISRHGIPRLKVQHLWKKDTPGGWLTHSSPNGPLMDVPAEVAERIDQAAT